eukprot:scaffold165381_cov28-Tisochrysis_lutea.AAC.4
MRHNFISARRTSKFCSEWGFPPCGSMRNADVRLSRASGSKLSTPSRSSPAMPNRSRKKTSLKSDTPSAHTSTCGARAQHVVGICSKGAAKCRLITRRGSGAKAECEPRHTLGPTSSIDLKSFISGALYIGVDALCILSSSNAKRAAGVPPSRSGPGV